MSLLKDIEELFAHSEQRVLAAFPAVKCSSSVPGARGKRKLPKSDGKPRVLVITAKRRSKKRGFKGTLHVVKLSQGKYQVRKSIRLKYLTHIEAFIDSPGQQEYFELLFVQRGFTTSGESRLAFEVRNAAVRLEVLGSIYTFCRTHEKRTPAVAGIEQSELEAAAVLYGKQASAEDDRPGSAAKADPLASRASQPLLLQSTPSSIVGDGGDAANPLWAQREDRQLASLLEVVSVGAGSIEDVQERLTTELTALEDANVHEILENGDMVRRVLGGLSSTIGLLDDLEENLNVFDTKLRHMREDIAAIEDRNNRLELHSRNNQRLLDTLESLVGSLTLSHQTEEVLRYTNFNSANLKVVVEAAWDLQRSLEALSAPTANSLLASNFGDEQNQNRVPPGLADMAAVVSQRQRLHDVMRVFLNKATSFLSDELRHIGDAALSKASSLQATSRLRPLDHSSIRRRAAELAPLLEVIRVMRPAATGPLRDTYCEAINSLLRKEVHGAVSEARRGMQASEAAAGAVVEPDAIMKKADAIKTLERLSTAPSRQMSDVYNRMGSTTGGGSMLRDSNAPHEAFELLLNSFLPVLAEEAQQCIMLMFPRTMRADVAGVDLMARGKSVRFAPNGRLTPGASQTQAGQKDGSPVPPLPQEVLLDTSSPEVVAAVGALLQGIEGEIMSLVDSVKPQRALLCLPMLGVTLEWSRKLEGRSGCGPVLAMLRKFESRLRGQLTAYVEERVGAIQRYDGRSSMAGSSVKAVHVLPFIVNFDSLAERMEDLLQRWRVADARQAAGVRPAESASSAAGLRGASGNAGGLPPRYPTLSRLGSAGPQQSSGGSASRGAHPSLMLSPFEAMTQRQLTTAESADSSQGGREATSGTEGTEISFMESGGDTEDTDGFPSSATDSSRRQTVQSSGDEDRTPQQQAGTPVTPVLLVPALAGGPSAPALAEPESIGSVLREVADGIYDRIIGAMLKAVEAAAESDAKHGQRLRLENYAFFQLSLQALPTQRVPLLGKYLQQVTGLAEAAMRAYIQQQVDYFKFARILELSRKLDELMESVGVDEVPFQLNYQPQDVKQLLSTTMAGIDKKLAQVHARIEKHMRSSSPYLVEQVWAKLEGICLQRWGRMQDQMKLCYPSITLQPALPELKRIFQAAATLGS